MAFIEVPIQIVNEWIGTRLLCAVDAGAYFGSTAVFVLHRSNSIDCPDEKSRYSSNIFSMIGTIFLFCFWPSFNAGDETGIDRLYAITYMSQYVPQLLVRFSCHLFLKEANSI
ncbi:unnamed protein product [Rotaria socialis]|uniref:Ammonium transporter AmtB-like domain-containing protein n=1 Tax=Rotaria socialis TaxID=392032 RepID=A0A820M0P9_9BILA|nr:unnamed protein product [Rotaria socialis]CAF4365069.1 unnamed protein product [Rotaria socialis]